MSDTPLTDASISHHTAYSGYGRDRISFKMEHVEVEDCRAIERELRERIAELEASFELRWEADMRAIKRWQAEAPGRELTWPDHADLCVWLMDRIAELEAECNALRAAREKGKI